MLVPSKPFSRKMPIAAARIARLLRARILRSAGSADSCLAATSHNLRKKLTLASDSIIEKVDALVKFRLSSGSADRVADDASCAQGCHAGHPRRLAAGSRSRLARGGERQRARLRRNRP